MSEKIKSFRDLRIWQEGMNLVECVYKATASFPGSEAYGLPAQIRRAAVSIPSNVAEGFRRKHPKEYKQFLAVALGSCGELETQLEISKRLGYLKGEEFAELVGRLDYPCRMIQTLVKKLQ